MIIPILMQIALAILVFLIGLNEFLQGSRKSRIRSILLVLHLAIIIAMFVLFGWKWGFISLATICVCVFLFAPIVIRTAVKILGHRASPKLIHQFVQLSHQKYTLVSQEQLDRLLGEYDLTFEDISVWPEIYQEEWALAMRNHDVMRCLFSLIRDRENQMVIAAKIRQRCLGTGSIGRTP